MILLVSTCAEPLHELEFVRPVRDILEEEGIPVDVKQYDTLTQNDFQHAAKVIICGTSLQDNKYLDNLDKFVWIKEYESPLLGICAGMQIIGLIHGGKLKEETEIGYYDEEFDNFLGLNGKQQVYHLHNKCVEFPETFTVCSKGKVPQAINNGNMYGVLFHPEVRQKEMILEFLKI